MTSSGPPDADPRPPAAPVPRPRRGYWLPGAIALVALVGIGVAVGAGDLDHSPPHALHGPDLAQQLALGIQAQQGASRPPDVRCPASEPVRDGWQFVCQLAGNGTDRPIQVVEIDNRGHLRWHLGP
jgi:hypothetical protein